MRTLRAAGAGPAVSAVIAEGPPTMRKEGSSYLQWDTCPLCTAAVLAVVPNGTVNDAAIRTRVENISVSVAGPAAAAATGQIDPRTAGDSLGPLGDGFGGAEGPVPTRFRTLFKRSAKLLSDYAARNGAEHGPPTRSDISRAEYDNERDLWLDAADWTWDEGIGDK